MRTQFLLLGPGILLASFLAATLVMAAAPSSKPESMHRVVIDVTADGIEPWTGVLNNIENLRRAFGRDNSEIHVIGRGKGIGMMLAKNALADRMKTLADEGVAFAACENTMRKKKVTKVDLLPFVTTVDSGVAELVRKQEAGWAYLKA